MPDTSNTPPKPKRRRGGQPGNLNAYKHGFYSRNFRLFEKNDLRKIANPDLAGEINALRVAIRRLIELSDANTDTDTGIRLLSTLSLAFVRLASLLRSQSSINPSAYLEDSDPIGQILTEVRLELESQSPAHPSPAEPDP